MQTFFFRITVLAALFLLTATTGSRAQTAAMPVMRIAFAGEPTAYMDYANGSMTLTDEEGQVVTLPAKFRTRGATAQEYMMKPSLNMKLRTDDYSAEADSSLLGMRSCSSWILDAMAIDRICMRNRVAFDVWNAFSRLPYDTSFDGRNGTVGRFVELYINDRYYGIYCLSDRINRKLLDLKKVKTLTDGTLQVRGVLYKNGTQNLLDQNHEAFSDDYRTCVAEWHNAWELTFPEDEASEAVWQPLLEALRQGRTAAYVKRHFFLDNLADYQLLVMALGIADNWGNKNKYFSMRNMNKSLDDADSLQADKRRFVVTPWDLDTSLGGAYDGSYYDGNYTDWPVDAIMKNAPYPIDCLAADAEYLSLLRSRWLQLRTDALSPDSVARRMDDYCRLFTESGAWQRMTAHYDAQPNRPMYVSDLAGEIAQVLQWYRQRYAEMDAYFNVSDGISTPQTATSLPSSAAYDLGGRPVGSSAPSKKSVTVLRGRKHL